MNQPLPSVEVSYELPNAFSFPSSVPTPAPQTGFPKALHELLNAYTLPSNFPTSESHTDFATAQAREHGSSIQAPLPSLHSNSLAATAYHRNNQATLENGSLSVSPSVHPASSSSILGELQRTADEWNHPTPYTNDYLTGYLAGYLDGCSCNPNESLPPANAARTGTLVAPHSHQAVTTAKVMGGIYSSANLLPSSVVNAYSFGSTGVAGSLSNQERPKTEKEAFQTRWEKHRSTIERLYLREEKSLQEVMNYMEERHQLFEKKAAYKKALGLWKMKRSIPAFISRAIVAIEKKRRLEENKDTEFFYKRQLVQPERVEQFRKRKHLIEAPPPAETPKDLTYGTPRELLRPHGFLSPDHPKEVPHSLASPEGATLGTGGFTQQSDIEPAKRLNLQLPLKLNNCRAAKSLPNTPALSTSPYRNAYSSSGFDMLGVIMRVVARPKPQIDIGIVDRSCAFVVCDVTHHDIPIVYCSDVFERLTGYSRHEILGKNCRFLQAPDGQVQAGCKRRYVDDSTVLQVKIAIAKRQEAQVSLINYRKGGQPFVNLLTLIPITYDSEEVKYYVGLSIDLVETPTALRGLSVCYKHRGNLTQRQCYDVDYRIRT